MDLSAGSTGPASKPKERHVTAALLLLSWNRCSPMSAQPTPGSAGILPASNVYAVASWIACCTINVFKCSTNTSA
jgi:hypothetical protein